MLFLSEPQNIPSWEGPRRIMESEPWPHTAPPKNQTMCWTASSRCIPAVHLSLQHFTEPQNGLGWKGLQRSPNPNQKGTLGCTAAPRAPTQQTHQRQPWAPAPLQRQPCTQQLPRAVPISATAVTAAPGLMAKGSAHFHRVISISSLHAHCDQTD